MEKKIFYFDKLSKMSTDKTIELARERAKELGIKDILVASNHGSTGMKLIKAFKGSKVNIVVVANGAGYKKEGWAMTAKQRQQLEGAGAQVLACSHALGGGIEDAFEGNLNAKAIAAQTLYAFSQGMKVCVEISLMAADAGLIDPKRDVIAIAGTGAGADTCVVIKPTYARKFFDLKVREIVAMPSFFKRRD